MHANEPPQFLEREWEYYDRIDRIDVGQVCNLPAWFAIHVSQCRAAWQVENLPHVES
jgi:hypothetical protein